MYLNETILGLTPIIEQYRTDEKRSYILPCVVMNRLLSTYEGLNWTAVYDIVINFLWGFLCFFGLVSIVAECRFLSAETKKYTKTSQNNSKSCLTSDAPIMLQNKTSNETEFLRPHKDFWFKTKSQTPPDCWNKAKGILVLERPKAPFKLCLKNRKIGYLACQLANRL